MKNTLKFIFLLLLIGNKAYSITGSEIRITGKIDGIKDGIVILINEKNAFMDTASIANGIFTFNVKGIDISDPKMHAIYVPSLGDFTYPKTVTTCSFFIDSESISLSMKIDNGSLSDPEVKGSPTYKEYLDIFLQLPSETKIQSVVKDYNEAFKKYDQEKSDINMASLKHISAVMDSLYREKRKDIIQAIPSHSSSYAMAFIVSSYFISDSVSLQEQLIAQFSPKIQKSYYIQKMQAKIVSVKNCSVGAMAPDFTLMDDKNMEHTLSSFKGKIVLIDFWATWCGPCKKELPNIIALHELYKDKGLVVIGVSVDKDKEAWLKMLKEKNMTYLNLLDNKNVSKNSYQVTGIPHIILIGKDGRILAKNIRGEEINLQIIKAMIQ